MNHNQILDEIAKLRISYSALFEEYTKETDADIHYSYKRILSLQHKLIERWMELYKEVLESHKYDEEFEEVDE